MQRQSQDGAGRRPLLSGNRQMLLDIRDSLSHVRKQQQTQPDGVGGAPSPLKSDKEGVNCSGGDKAGGKQMDERLGYNKKAMAKIRQSLQGYKTAGMNGLSQLNINDECSDVPVDVTQRPTEGRNGYIRPPAIPALSGYQAGGNMMRKASFEDRYCSAGNSESSSIRSESPTTGMLYRPHGASPLPPGRGLPAPSATGPSGGHVQQMIRRMSPAQTPSIRMQTGAYNADVVPPNSRHPQAAQYCQLLPSGHDTSRLVGLSSSFGQPTALTQDGARIVGYYVQNGSSPLSSHSVSPASTPLVPGPPPPTDSGFVPQPVHAWGATNPPIVMQQVNSREVQKPILQTATAPLSPPPMSKEDMAVTEQLFASQLDLRWPNVQLQLAKQQMQQMQLLQQQQPQQQQPQETPLQLQQQEQLRQQNLLQQQKLWQQQQLQQQQHLQQQQLQHQQQHLQQQQQLQHQLQQKQQHQMSYVMNQQCHAPSPSESPVPRACNQSPMSIISTASSPSTNSDIPEKPPPPYPGRQPVKRFCQPAVRTEPTQFAVSQETEFQAISENFTGGDCESNSDSPPPISGATNDRKHMCTSPKPERRADAQQKDAERQDTQVKMYSPDAYKFYMEQHVENVIKSCQQRMTRSVQLEHEMAKIGLSEEAQVHLRLMLHKKESNYLRLKRAKMSREMFKHIQLLGIGAFGEVTLVRKADMQSDTQNLYAMKTLRKQDVVRRNQVAHVKAERDILSEADCEWVVKLYYSFQDEQHLYFVMDYIPGGDMMSLLIKLEIFEEDLAQFYIAELILAIESVHSMGFIHRDIKPDNILIDRDGHIKLTDFGLCTGFRWTHNSKYYQKGNHLRQDSMDPSPSWGYVEPKKPLERRKLRHQRFLAHSLVGTPNYIAPEVLLRAGYTECCDWWSVGVILYEMLVGQPPFLAQTAEETQKKVIQWESSLQMPRECQFSRAAADLILQLCCAPEQRLGRGGAKEVKVHPFFNSINFAGLRQQPAPYKPKIRYATDTSNFDSVDCKPSEDEEAIATAAAGVGAGGVGATGGNGEDSENAFFVEFTFRRFFDDRGHPVATKMQSHDPDSNEPVYV